MTGNENFHLTDVFFVDREHRLVIHNDRILTADMEISGGIQSDTEWRTNIHGCGHPKIIKYPEITFNITEEELSNIILGDLKNV